MFVDSHAHLDMDRFDSDREEVINRAFSEGVKNILNVSFDLESSRRSVELSKKYDGIYAAVGVHPHDAKQFSDDIESSLKELAKEKKVVALGEMGLDYHYDNSPREEQKDAFIRQLRLAAALDLPVIIHSRDAIEDTVKILSENIPPKKGVIHCFSGDEKNAEIFIKMGFYLSFGGPVTFKNNKTAKKLFSSISLDKVMIETDCPYLAPTPLRGKRNEPSYVRYVAEKIAEMKGLSVEDVARITSVNFFNAFGIKQQTEPVIVYPIRNSLYLNITNRCTNACSFCARNTSYTVKGHFLRLEREPSVDEILSLVDKAFEKKPDYEEVVFCGFGEPLTRLDDVIAISRVLKKKGIKIRINTNGHGNLIANRKIAVELAGLVDAVSVSLNASDSEAYTDLCKPRFGQKTFEGIIEFVKECKEVIPSVTLTAVKMQGEDVEKCREIAEALGVDFRARFLNNVG